MILMQDGIAASAARPSQRRIADHDPEGRAVAIVGAGFSGTMAAIHLRRVLPRDCVIYLFERTGRFARGPAYAASDVPHLLNVRTANMSAMPDDPSHFERWMATQAARWPDEISTTEAGTFATRRIYGRYLRALLHEEMTLSGGRVRLCADEVVDLDRVAGLYRLRCTSGREITVSALVMATGNLPSTTRNDEVVCHDPWAACATTKLRPNEPVLIVGTGLTMVDLALGMSGRGFTGPIVALSRRGLVPQRHGAPQPAVPCAPFTLAECQSLSSLLRVVRRRIRDGVAAGHDWRAVIDGLRPITAGLWQTMPHTERNRFLRHLRPYWDIHRHRLAPGPADAFGQLLQSGALQLKQGRVQAIETGSGAHGTVAHVDIRDRGVATAERVEVQRVIYATGIGVGTKRCGLIASLIGAGLARTDSHGMGVDVSETLRLTTAGEARAEAIWALGPIVRGVFWECTAVPDIRIQARTVADEVMRHLRKVERAKVQ